MQRITFICANTLLESRSRYRYDQIQQDFVDLIGDYYPERRFDETEISFEVQNALDDLPANLRTVVVLSDVFDLAHAEIAKQLGISATAVKVRLHRGRKRMRLAVQASREINESIATEDDSYGASRAV